MKTIFHILDHRSSENIWLLSLLSIFVLSIVYGIVGRSFVLEPFYIFPILIASWYGSDKTGILLALISTMILILIRSLVFQHPFGIELILYYGVPYAFAYSTAAFLITNFRNVHRIEVEAADTDYLTGACSSRSFYVELANELVRSQRYGHVFSLAYIDIDDFKNINDTYGHARGDKVLIEVAGCLRSSLRQSDTVARLGGDEFACLLPETTLEDAKHAFHKASSLLQKSMDNRHWPVTFSVGVVTFEEIPNDIKEAVKVADDLMYSVKNKEKNNIAYKIWHGKT